MGQNRIPFHLRTCDECDRFFYTASRNGRNKCINHLKDTKRVNNGFIGFWSKGLRKELRATSFPRQDRKDILGGLLR